MPPHPATRRLLLAATLALSLGGCAQYSSIKEKRPAYTYKPLTPVGTLIVKALETRSNNPSARLGRTLDAAAAASATLKAHPSDPAALRDYNFAVSRAFEIIADASLNPYTAAGLSVPGAEGPWRFRGPVEPRPERNPSNYRVLPADRFEFNGTYVTQRSIKPGLGAPLVAVGHFEDFRKLDRFSQGKHVYYGVTGLIRFEGRSAIIEIHDPLHEETARLNGHAFPLGADFTAPLGLALAKESPRKLEIARLLRPQKYAETARLARLQPYEPAKIPVICVHGLADSVATWTPMINALRADPEIRSRYQFWFYSYPSGYPYPHSAAIMRRQLDEIGAAYPGHKKAVLIGHSMGGIISRTMLTDSGMTIWNTFFRKPPAQSQLSASSRKTLSDALIFKPRNDVARVIFIAAPHRGSELATNWVGRIGSSLVKGPTTLMKIAEETAQAATFNQGAIQLSRMPNSIDTLSPDNRFVKVINTLPLTPGIPYHSIMGDRGKGGSRDKTPPVSSDGVVPYWSSHLDGARSELIVPSTHSAHQNPQAIEEVRRILKLHAKGAGGQ